MRKFAAIVVISGIGLSGALSGCGTLSSGGISLGQGEGLYVRDLRTGRVQLIEGPCQFMLEAWQELHEKRLSPEAEAILANEVNSRLQPAAEQTHVKVSGSPTALPDR